MGQLGPANGNTAETRERQYWNPIKRLLHAAAVAGAPVPAVVPVAGAPVDGTHGRGRPFPALFIQ
jgi:hypothetical protein